MIGFLLKRPVAVIMSTIAFLVLGAVAMFQLPVSLMPDVDIPEMQQILPSKTETAAKASRETGKAAVPAEIKEDPQPEAATDSVIIGHYFRIQGRERNDNHEVRIRHFDRLCFYRGQSESGCCDEQLS